LPLFAQKHQLTFAAKNQLFRQFLLKIHFKIDKTTSTRVRENGTREVKRLSAPKYYSF